MAHRPLTLPAAIAAVAEADQAFEESIPIESVDQLALARALGTPFLSLDRFQIYPALEDKAAALLISLCALQPFPDYNNRAAALLLPAFVELNDRIWFMPPGQLREWTQHVTAWPADAHWPPSVDRAAELGHGLRSYILQVPDDPGSLGDLP